MSRTARNRDKNRPHHLISRSIPELDLFRSDQDKEIYLSLMKSASRVYRITIIAYCLMDNHVHILVHPYGGDISKFMKNLNNNYAKYYNRTYDRRGHLYGERFKNIIIKDEVQLLRTSTYIHNNPKDLLHRGYKSIEDYPYSSLQDFTNPHLGRGLANPSLVFKYVNGSGVVARNHYRCLMEIQCQGHEAFEKELEEAFGREGYTSDKQLPVRNVSPKTVLNELARLLGQNETVLSLSKYSRQSRGFRCLAAICLRIFADLNVKELREFFIGYTSSGISQLSKAGCELLDDVLYNRMIEALSS